MSDRVTGTVKWFDVKKGYGFIVGDVEKDIFVHYTSIQGDGFRKLEDGQQVEFTLKEGPKGFEATECTVVEQLS